MTIMSMKKGMRTRATSMAESDVMYSFKDSAEKNLYYRSSCSWSYCQYPVSKVGVIKTTDKRRSRM